MSPAREPVLVRLCRVTKSYSGGPAKVDALMDVNLALSAGDFLAIVGPSGCGKTTCLNIIGALDTPTSGTCELTGHCTRKLDATGLARLRRATTGFVFQGFNLLPGQTAQRNVELPLLYLGVPPRERERRAHAALDLVGLGDRARHMPSEVSGGQQQRVAIARAIVTEPRVLISDEPTGALDAATSRAIMDVLVDLNRRLRLAIALVTHDAEIAARARRRVVFRDGRIVREEVAERWHAT